MSEKRIFPLSLIFTAAGFVGLTGLGGYYMGLGARALKENPADHIVTSAPIAVVSLAFLYYGLRGMMADKTRPDQPTPTP